MQSQGVKILLIEDNPAEARLLQELLKGNKSAQFSWVCVKRLKEALNRLVPQEFDVILLDLTLPDSVGLDSLKPLGDRAPHLPIVVLTNTNDEDLAIEAVRRGAQDYLLKRQLNTELLVRSLRYAIERKQGQEALRKAKEELEVRVVERTAELAAANEQLKQEISDRQRIQHQLSWQAAHDPLTGLANRRQFEQSLEEALIEAKAVNYKHILCYLDLDQFKIVNDTCGHAAGDELLRQVTALLQSKIRKSDVLARLGGDEFGVLLYHCSLELGRRVADKLLESIQAFRFVWHEKMFAIGASIGLVAIDATSESGVSVLSRADTAMYAAKDGGRNRVHVYEAGDHDLVQRCGDMQWVSRIVKALEENRFCLYRQAIAPIQPDNLATHHYELLLRMQDEKGQLVLPMAFIPAAERYNLMSQIDRWVIQTLFCVLQQVNSDAQSVYTVNLSAASLNDDQFLDFLQQQFLQHQILPSTICFEITETSTIANLKKAAHFIHQLKKIGCHFALDDFGSGMSSLAYLKNLPVDYLKIDGHFIKNIVSDRVSAAMIEAINHIGHVMGLQTIAEFVENEEILEKVKRLGVDYAQGYGIGKPHPFYEEGEQTLSCCEIKLLKPVEGKEVQRVKVSPFVA